MEKPRFQDHYAVLGVEHTATTEQIKRAARKLYLRHHPDKGGDEKHFREASVREAVDILKDETARSEFDRMYPRVKNEWADFHRFLEKLRTHQEKANKEAERRRMAKEQELKDQALRNKQAEAERRSQEATKRAREAQDRAARERLRKARELELEEQRREAMRAAEQARIRAEREKSRLREREKQAEERSRMAAGKRRTELERQARERIANQKAQETLKKQREQWANMRETIENGHLSPSQEAEERRDSDTALNSCSHLFWSKTKGKADCQVCEKTFSKYAFICIDCSTVACRPCSGKLKLV